MIHEAVSREEELERDWQWYADRQEDYEER